MQLPFSVEQFLQVFEEYNLAVWPAQIVAYVLGAMAVAFAIVRRRGLDRAVSGVLAFFWFFMGAVYHIGFFSPINKAAYVFGSVFIMQGLLFTVFGVWKNQLVFAFKPGLLSVVGALLIAYAMVVYPLIGAAAGHGWPHSPSFGIAPCPGTIFTFGLLLWTASRVPIWLLVIPALWSVVGFVAAIKLGVVEDVGLLVSGVLGATLLVARNIRLRTGRPAAGSEPS